MHTDNQEQTLCGCCRINAVLSHAMNNRGNEIYVEDRVYVDQVKYNGKSQEAQSP